ncbi:MAG: hypothetical protein Q7S74_01685 [Nanoarchaeota archaeon]|nr:hypothetical protein [Nanoarchaeota archaeon]
MERNTITNKRVIKRLWEYQKERFPVLFILISGTAVVLSSAAVSIGASESILNIPLKILFAIIVSFLFMLHIRVIDEYRDYLFDSKYHNDRPVQSGVISLKELLIIDIAGLFLQFIITASFSLKASILWFAAFGYTIVSGNDFFLGNKIKRKFFLYNGLNLIQLFIFQFYLYTLFNPNFTLNILLFVHFIFAVSNLFLVEFARKMKVTKQESKVKDTYSSRFGKKGASLIYIFIAFFSFILLVYSLMIIKPGITSLGACFFFLDIIVICSLFYIINDNKISEIVVQGGAALFYVATHLILTLSRI